MPATPSVNISIRNGEVSKLQSLSQNMNDTTLPAGDDTTKTNSSTHPSWTSFTQNTPDDYQAVPRAEEDHHQFLNPKSPASFRFEPLRRDMVNGSASPASDSEEKNRRQVIIGWLICCFIFLILVPVLSLVLGVKFHNPDFSYERKQHHNFTDRMLVMSVVLVSADPASSSMIFDWTIDEEKNSDCSNTVLDNCATVNIYFDNNLLINSNGDSSDNVPTNSIPTSPVFRYNTSSAADDVRANSPVFRTNILLFSAANNRKSSLISYPFDYYVAELFMFAQDANNNAVGLYLNVTGGNAVGFRTNAMDISDETDSELIDISITLSRGYLVRAFCIIVMISIWLIALVLLLLTFTSIIFGFRQKVEVLVVPVATIFAFTQLRSSMPGAPAGFGDVLDFIGLLPCLGILAFSAAMSLGAFLLTDPSSKSHDAMTWGLLRSELVRFKQERRAKNAKKYLQE